MTFAPFTAFGSTLELTTAEQPDRAHPDDPIEIWAHEPGENVGFNLGRLHPGSGRFESDDAAVKTTVESLFARHEGGAVARLALGVARAVFVLAKVPIAIFLPVARTSARVAPGAAALSMRSGGVGGLLLLVIAVLAMAAAAYAALAIVVVLSPLLITAGVTRVWISLSQRSVSKSLRLAAHQVAIAAAQRTAPTAVSATASTPNGWAIVGILVGSALLMWGSLYFKAGQISTIGLSGPSREPTATFGTSSPTSTSAVTFPSPVGAK